MCAPQSKYLRQKLNCCDNAKFPNYKAVMDGSKKRSLPLRYAAFNGYLNRLVEDGDTRWIFFNPVVTHFVWWGPGGALRGAATASLSRWNGQQQKQVWKLKIMDFFAILWSNIHLHLLQPIHSLPLSDNMLCYVLFIHSIHTLHFGNLWPILWLVIELLFIDICNNWRMNRLQWLPYTCKYTKIWIS